MSSCAYVMYGSTLHTSECVTAHGMHIDKISSIYPDIYVYIIVSKYDITPLIPLGARLIVVDAKGILPCLYQGLNRLPQYEYICLTQICHPYRQHGRSCLPNKFSSSHITACDSNSIPLTMWVPKHIKLQLMVFLWGKCKGEADIQKHMDVHMHDHIQPPDGNIGEVCMVGNGPISDLERKHINLCHTVVRFNDTKNRLPSERCDIHIMRKNRIHPSSHDNYPVSSHDGVSNVMLVGNNASYTGVLKPFVTHRIQYANKHSEKVSVFRACPTSVFDIYTRLNISKHPSLGLISLSYFDAMPEVRSIHTYGMNFNFTSSHSKNEMDLLQQCCIKCIIHKPERSTYSPAPRLDMLSIIIILILMSIFAYYM